MSATPMLLTYKEIAPAAATLSDSDPQAQTSASELEATSLRALQEREAFDTPESESFARITRLASRLFQASAAAVLLTDENRQWFKSRTGIALREFPHENKPCAEV